MADVDITQARLHERFTFDAEAGVLIWRIRPLEDFADVRAWKTCNTLHAGKVAGRINSLGYRQIQIEGKKRAAHRLIWTYVNGPIPDGLQVDHINGVRSDNRIDNLRLVTNTENARNSSIRRSSASGVTGVTWHKTTGKWVANIRVDGQDRHLGLFDTIEDAACARAKANLEHGFHPGHGKSSLPAPPSSPSGDANG